MSVSAPEEDLLDIEQRFVRAFDTKYRNGNVSEEPDGMLLEFGCRSS